MAAFHGADNAPRCPEGQAAQAAPSHRQTRHFLPGLRTPSPCVLSVQSRPGPRAATLPRLCPKCHRVSRALKGLGGQGSPSDRAHPPVPQFPLLCGEDDMVLSVGSSSEASTDVRCAAPSGPAAPLGWLEQVQSRDGVCGVWPHVPPRTCTPPDSGLVAASWQRLLHGARVWGTWTWPCRRLCRSPSEVFGVAGGRERGQAWAPMSTSRGIEPVGLEPGPGPSGAVAKVGLSFPGVFPGPGSMPRGPPFPLASPSRRLRCGGPSLSRVQCGAVCAVQSPAGTWCRVLFEATVNAGFHVNVVFWVV